MGISEAFYIPAALALIADFHTGPTRSRAVGLHQMAIYCGVIVGGFGGYVADHPTLGWRCAFDACGVVGMLYAVPLFLLLRDAPTPPDGRRPARATLAGAALRELLEQRLVHPAGAVLHAAGAGRLGRARLDAGDPEGAVRHRPGPGRRVGDALLAGRGDRRRACRAAGWPTAGCGATPRGRIFVSAIGMAPDRAGDVRRRQRAADRLLWVAVAFLVLFGLGWGFFDCNNMPILCQIVRPELRATGYGIMNLVSISCGGFADWGFGALRDRHVPLVRDLRRVRQRRRPLDRAGAADPAEGDRGRSSCRRSLTCWDCL